MPIKKRRGPLRGAVSPTGKPGIARKHLVDNYSERPDAPDDLLNGHVLYIYLVKCCSSRARTERELLSFLPPASSHPGINNAIKRVVDRTLNTVKRLSDPKQFGTFSSVCSEKFSFGRVDADGVEEMPDCQMEVDLFPSTSTSAQPIPFSGKGNVKSSTVSVAKSPVKTRQISKCTSCRRLHLPVKSMRKKQLEMRKEHGTRIKDMRIAQKKKAAIKMLNQKLREKKYS
ncbi:hypothetical protein SNE40_006117 [Patella caerulea]|uniref:Uncharacterized protein n=1 Tax=Patella caerulea TaxID=87958 RepID=A0AAN8K1Q4_PATCE